MAENFMSLHNNSCCKRPVVPRLPYLILYLWLQALRVPFREEILWDMKHGYRAEYRKRKKLNRVDRRLGVQEWFVRQVMAAFIQGTWMRIRTVTWLIRIFG